MTGKKSDQSNSSKKTNKNTKSKENGRLESENVLRRRRAQSVGPVDDETARESRLKAGSPDNPCHNMKDSLFSSSSNYTNYRGLLNLCFILLVVSNARVALENIIKYGILVDPIAWFYFMIDPTVMPSLLILLSLNIFIINSFVIERFLLVHGINETFCECLVVINLISLLCIPPYNVYKLNCHPFASSIALAFVSVLFLKLISYHMVNFWLRRDFRTKYRYNGGSYYRYVKRQRSFSSNQLNNLTDLTKLEKMSISGELIVEEKLISFPDNLNLKNIYYFVSVPTLCYELNFPRSQRTRKRFLLRRFIEMFFLVQLNLALVQQWIIPTINNSLMPLKEMNLLRMCERLLKIAIPNHIIWLIFFYSFFHSTLNFWAELLRFGDREFYRDWWNSESVQYFWQNWNIPVHKWCLRHLYKPLLRRGFSRFQASTAVFFVSAFFHEYLVSVPLKMFRIWAFSGMLAQIPLAIFVNRYFSNYPHYANICVWLSIILGQPLAILMYYHDWYVINQLKTS